MPPDALHAAGGTGGRLQAFLVLRHGTPAGAAIGYLSAGHRPLFCSPSAAFLLAIGYLSAGHASLCAAFPPNLFIMLC